MAQATPKKKLLTVSIEKMKMSRFNPVLGKKVLFLNYGEARNWFLKLGEVETIFRVSTDFNNESLELNIVSEPVIDFIKKMEKEIGQRTKQNISSIIKTIDDKSFVKVKIEDGFSIKKPDDTKQKLTLAAHDFIPSGSLISLMVRVQGWKYNKKCGIRLIAKKIKVVRSGRDPNEEDKKEVDYSEGEYEVESDDE